MTRFQQLGAFVAVGENLTEQQVYDFAAIGGAWIVPLLKQLSKPDDESVLWNQNNIETLKKWCGDHGVRCGGWFNGWAGNPTDDAKTVAKWVLDHDLDPAVLDLEASYQFPGGKPALLPRLVSQVRANLPLPHNLIVSTNSPNDSMVWNGGSLGYSASMWKLGVRIAPQWYNGPIYAGSMWMDPEQTMQWAQLHGNVDNLYVPSAPSQRAIPLSWWHGTLEASGVEGADMSRGLLQLNAARPYGYTTGFSVYTLESMPPPDYEAIRRWRGRLYL